MALTRRAVGVFLRDGVRCWHSASSLETRTLSVCSSASWKPWSADQHFPMFSRKSVHDQLQDESLKSSSSSPCLDRKFSSIIYPPSEAFVGSKAPDFTGPAVVDGEIRTISLSDYKNKYVILFFYPKDFTFVCPTEIIAFSDRAKEFEELNCQLIGASTDTEETHLAWIKTPRKKGGLGHMQIPLLADTTKEIAARYGCLIPSLGIALRGLYIINPEGVLEQVIVNNLPIGRDVDEAKRLLQAIQFVKEYGEVCPAGWKPGAKTMVADPEKSLDYFSTQDDVSDDFGTKIQSVKSAKEFQEVVSSGQKVVVDFYAPWCGKCRMIAPLLEELQDQYPGVKFVKVDTTDERLEAVGVQYSVKALPAFKFFKEGQEVHTEVVGYKRKPLAEAVAALDNI